MPIRIPILTFAEYAAIDVNGKLTIGGAVNGITLRRKAGVPADANPEVRIPALYLVAVFEGGIGDGLEHRMGLRIVNDDGAEVAGYRECGAFRFRMNRFGRPMRAQFVVSMQGLRFPRPGDYEFEVVVDDTVLATAPFYVTDATPSPEE